MSDEWPPDWEDLAEEDLPPEADEARLAEVTALLAAAPMPVLPDAVAARIGVALTAEAAFRGVLTTEAAASAATPSPGDDAPLDAAAPDTAAPGPAVSGDGARIVEPARSRVWPRRSGGGGARRTVYARSLAVAAVVIALTLAGVGYGLSRGGTPAGSSQGTVAGSGPVPVERSNAVPGMTPTSAPGPTESARAPRISAPAPANSPHSSGTPRSTPAKSASLPAASGSSGPASSPSPRLSASGSPTAATPGPTTSAPATSASATPTTSAPTTPAPTTSVSATPTPTASSSSSVPPLPPLSGSPNASPSRGPNVSWVVVASGTDYLPATLASQVEARLNGSALPGSTPSAAEQACVTRVIGSTVPELFDEATFQGSPAYIIAIASEAWVVGTGCSATALDLLDTVVLPG
jgi:hypothetical protein